MISSSNTDSSLQLTTMKLGAAAWDQFAENGPTADYDENIYPIAIDKSHPQCKQREAEAVEKARDIKRSALTKSEEPVTDKLAGEDNDMNNEDK
jgi:PAB1-binding protein PBP1